MTKEQAWAEWEAYVDRCIQPAQDEVVNYPVLVDYHGRHWPLGYGREAFLKTPRKRRRQKGKR